MKKHNLLTVIVLMAIGTWSMSAQEYLEMIDKGTFTVYEIQQSAQAYFEKAGTDQGTGYKQFKRWEYNALRMQGDDGRLKSIEYYNNELARFEAYLNESTEARLGGTTGNWVEEGPASWDSYQGWNPGVGRVTGFAVDPTDSDHYSYWSEYRRRMENHRWWHQLDSFDGLFFEYVCVFNRNGSYKFEHLFCWITQWNYL